MFIGGNIVWMLGYSTAFALQQPHIGVAMMQMPDMMFTGSFVSAYNIYQAAKNHKCGCKPMTCGQWIEVEDDKGDKQKRHCVLLDYNGLPTDELPFPGTQCKFRQIGVANVKRLAKGSTQLGAAIGAIGLFGNYMEGALVNSSTFLASAGAQGMFGAQVTESARAQSYILRYFKLGS